MMKWITLLHPIPPLRSVSINVAEWFGVNDLGSIHRVIHVVRSK